MAKMGVLKKSYQAVKGNFSSTFNLGKWIGIDFIKGSANTLQGMYTGLYKKPISPQIPNKEESFNDFMQKIGMSETDIKKRIGYSRKLLRVYLATGIAILGYTIFLMIEGEWFASVLTMVMLLLLSTFSFQEHLYYYQLKNQ